MINLQRFLQELGAFLANKKLTNELIMYYTLRKKQFCLRDITGNIYSSLFILNSSLRPT